MGEPMTAEELRDRYLAATAKIVDAAQRRGDARLSLPLRAHELSVALNAGDFAAALPVFEDLAAQYETMEQPEPWLVNSLTWASGRFADHFRERPQGSAEGGGYPTVENLRA
jgi:hypothetical protein